MRLAQDDILDFCVNANYQHHLTWPDAYWPAPTPPSDAAWNESIASFARSREKLKAPGVSIRRFVGLKTPTGLSFQIHA